MTHILDLFSTKFTINTFFFNNGKETIDGLVYL